MSSWLLGIGYWLLVAGYWLLAAGYGLLVAGYWLLVAGYWLLVTCYWLLAAGSSVSRALVLLHRCLPYQPDDGLDAKSSVVGRRTPIPSRTTVSTCCLLFLALMASVARTSEEPLAVTVFYSKEDPQWKKTEFVVDSSAKLYGQRVVVEKVSYDDPKGYARLAKIEKELPVDRPGEITAVIGRFPLTSSGKRRDIENYIAPVIARLLAGENFKKRLAAKAAAFAQERFPGGSLQVTRDFEKLGGIYYRVSRGGTVLGWVVDAYRTIHCPVCYDAQLLVAVSAGQERKVLGLQPVRAFELYGKALPKERLQIYLRQFEGMKADTSRRIDAITGATKTSIAYEKAVRSVLQTLRDRTSASEASEGGK